MARPCRLIQCPVGGSVGGCGARAVSRKTPIYFIDILHETEDVDDEDKVSPANELPHMELMDGHDSRHS